MAKSVENHRDDIRTSIHGRRVGLTHDDYLVGFKQAKQVVTNATSDTTGTAIPNHGFHSVITTTDDTWTLTDPTPGCQVSLGTASTSTGTHTITTVAVIVSTASTGGTNIAMNAMGESCTLVGLSTAVWLVTSNVNAVVFS